MIVSWNWLKDYVDLPMTSDELAERLAMAGLNHESTHAVGDDLAIDLEITSNRSDCLGHIGVAREISVLWNQPLESRAVTLRASGPAVPCTVRIDCPELCPRYTARFVRGVAIGPSPAWLAKRLETLGIAVISNVVDITNYVMMECGQPLHAFDLSHLRGQQVIVRSATANEPFVAIDHHTYTLQPGMCVIADAERPVALGGVMGGADTEVSPQTRDLLIEAADFDPLSIRNTARRLNLKSPSSYRFERGVDPNGIDWASRRACELIVDLAGGEVSETVRDVQPQQPAEIPPIVLRWSQIPRILGITIDRGVVLAILERLGLLPADRVLTKDSMTLQAPSWRRDLRREIDLIEEIARVHGYDKIPEDVGVPMAASQRQDRHRVVTAVRQVLAAHGVFEAMTASVVDDKASNCFSPWTQIPPIRTSIPMLRGAMNLRRSLIPSLLESRRINESRANDGIELFEIAKVYWPRTEVGVLPDERWVLALSSGRSFLEVKGLLTSMLEALHVTSPWHTQASSFEFLDSDEQCEVWLNGERWGILGQLSAAGRKTTDLRRPTVVCELLLDVLQKNAQLIPQYRPCSDFPPIDFDFNFIVAESITWAELEKAVRHAAGPLLESIAYRETYRDPQRDGAERKRVLMTVRLRSGSHTLSGEEANSVHEAIIHACQTELQATLLQT